MWTLRDLWHFFNQQAEDEWRQQQVRRYSNSIPMTMRELLWNKNQSIDNNPAMNNWRSPTLEDYFQGMATGASPRPNPKGYT